MSAYVEAILLGIVQGIAEFLPISSSGHLVIAGELLRRATGRAVDPEANLHLNIALHAGTLGSILWVYRRELPGLFGARRIVALGVATLPLVVIAVLLTDGVKAAFDTPLVAGCGLLVTASLLAWTRSVREGDAGLDDVTPGRAALVGAFQSIAILPGISRSGSTIAGGLSTGLDRNAATTFSFLIAIPAILGATVLLLKDLLDGSAGPVDVGPLLAGAAVAFVVGIVSLGGLLRVVASGRLHWFAAYCAVVGIATIVWQLVELSSH